MLCEWRVRKKGQESNPYKDYRDFPNVFCLKINHGGKFTTPPKIRYKGGKVIELYTDHSVKKKHVFIKEPLVVGTTSEHNKPDIGSGREAEVDRLTWLTLRDTDPDVEWVECKETIEEENEVFELEEVDHEDYDSGIDLDEGVRRKELRKVSRMHKAKAGKGDFLNVFCLKINHGGTFTTPPKIRYKGGKVIELYTDHSVKKKHVFIKEPWWLVQLVNLMNMILVLVAISEPEVDVSEDEWLQEALKKLPIKSKKGEQPSRNKVDEENLIDDVEIDLADFKSHTDLDVEWVGCKETIEEENKVFELEEVDHEDYDCGTDIDEGVRRKALRKVARMHKAKAGKGETIWKENFFVREQFATSKLVKDKPLKINCRKKCKVGVSKQKVFRAKKMAYERVVVKIEVERPEDPDSEERKFKRIYVRLGPLKEGFRVCGRDFLGLDGCFLSGTYPNQILTAVGVDPTTTKKAMETGRKRPWRQTLTKSHCNCINFGVRKEDIKKDVNENKAQVNKVESKNKDSWKWFLEYLGDDLDLFKNSNFTFISDRQKEGQKSNILLNNMCEVLNRQLVDGMDNPIITCLEYIREYLMKRIMNVQKVQDKCDGPLIPNAAKVFKFIVTAAEKLEVGHNKRGCKSKRSDGDAGVGGSQQGGDAGVGGSQQGGGAGVGGSQTTQTLVGRAQHPSYLHASPTKMTKSSERRSGSSA
nr:hypothetical protein [Tanacetum cinerariifolium]